MAKAVKPKMTPLQRELNTEYNKELRRLKRFIRDSEKRGFSYPENILPEKPKRLTKRSVAKIQKIKPKDLYKKAKYTEPRTGITISGEQGRKMERRTASLKGAETKRQQATSGKKPQQPKAPKRRTEQAGQKPTRQEPKKNYPAIGFEVLSNVRAEIAKWSPSPNWSEFYASAKRHDKNVLERMLEGACREEGDEEIARRLEGHAEEVNPLVQEILYGSGGKDGREIQADFARFAAIIRGRSLTPDESIQAQEDQEYIEDYEEED